MPTQLRTPAGRVYPWPLPYAVIIGTQSVGTHASAAAVLALGCTIEDVPEPPPPPAPTLTEMQAARLAEFRGAAARCIATNVPTPWDTLRNAASVDFRDWCDGYLAAVATELNRVEEAIQAASTPAAVAAVIADWPEVS